MLPLLLTLLICVVTHFWCYKRLGEGKLVFVTRTYYITLTPQNLHKPRTGPVTKVCSHCTT